MGVRRAQVAQHALRLGISIVADRTVLAAAVGVRAAYLPPVGEVDDPTDRVLEFSRRARGAGLGGAAVARPLGVERLVDGA